MHACPVSLVSDSFRFYELSCQAPLTMGFSRQESWSGLPLPTPEMFLTQRSNPYLLHWQADSLPLCHLESLHTHTHTHTHTHVHVCACLVTSVVSDSLRPYGLSPSNFLCPWDSPDKYNGIDCHALLQRIFPTQGLNPEAYMYIYIGFLGSSGGKEST